MNIRNRNDSGKRHETTREGREKRSLEEEEEEEEEKEKEEGGEDEDEMDRWMALEYHQKAQVLDLNFILL